MSLLDHLRRIWLERRIRVTSVDLARERDELDYLEQVYLADSYNSELHSDILWQRDRIHDLEGQRNQLQFQLSKLSCSSIS